MNAEEFGKRIMELRKKKGLTQAKLAEQIHVSNKAVSRWETGEGFPEITLLKPLANALGVTVDDLLGEEEEENKDEPRKKWFFNLGRESSYEETAIEVGALKEGIIGSLKSGKWMFVLYILCLSGGLYLKGTTWNNAMNGVECQLTRNTVYGCLLLLGVSAIVMGAIQIRQWKKAHLDFLSMVVNQLVLVIFCGGYFLSYRDRMNRGFWKCEYFSVNHALMRQVTVISLVLALVTYILVSIGRWKKGESKMAEFWTSLVVFNKISFVCLVLSAVLPMLSSALCSIGLCSGILGLVLSLLGEYKKQTNGYIVFIVACFAGRYIFPWAMMLLSFLSVKGIFYGFL